MALTCPSCECVRFFYVRHDYVEVIEKGKVILKESSDEKPYLWCHRCGRTYDLEMKEIKE